MKKKAIKIAAASAVAASAIVAAAPAQSFAASSVAVTVDNAVLQMKKAFFTYNTPASQGEIADIAAVRAEYAKAKSMYASARTVVVKAGNVKLLDKLDGYYADFIQKKVITYIDAYTYGENYLKANKDGLQTAINAKNYDDVVKFSTELSYQLNSSRQTIIDRVYGPDTRALFRTTYREGSKALNDSILNDVAVYKSVVKLNDAVAKKDLAAGKVEVDNINTLLPKVTSALKEDLTAKVNTAVSAYNALVPAAVENVTFVNGVTLQVKFNKEVDKTSAETKANYDLAGYTAKTAVLGADNKTVTLTYDTVLAPTDATLTISPVATKADTKVSTAKYVTKVSYSDKVAPTVAGVDYTYNKDVNGKVVSANAVFTFSEPLSTVGTVSVNGVVATGYDVDLAAGTLTVKNLTVAQTYKVDVVGAKDVAGNWATSISQSITVPAQTVDSVKPTVAATFANNVVTLQFSKELTTVGTVKINGTAVDAAFIKQDATDKTKYTIDAQKAGFLGSVTFTYATVTVENYTDKAGNVGDKFTSAQGVLTKKTSAPTFVSAATSKDNSKLLLTFSEPVFEGDLSALNELTLKVQDNVYKTGATTDLTATNAKFGGFDVDGNGKVEGSELNVVAIDYAGLKEESKYTFDLAKNVVADYYGNKVASTVSFELTVPKAGSAAYTPKAQVVFTDSTVAAVGSVITVKYNEAVSDSALVAANYTFDGAALPTGTDLRFINDRQTVQITLPAGYVKVSGNYILTATNVVGTNGDTLTNGKAQLVVSALDTVAPTATKLTLLNSRTVQVDFSEKVVFPTDLTTLVNVTVKVNGTALTTGVTYNVDSNGVFTINLGKDVALTDTISVEFKGANIYDVSGNKLTDGVVNK